MLDEINELKSNLKVGGTIKLLLLLAIIIGLLNFLSRGDLAIRECLKRHRQNPNPNAVLPLPTISRPVSVQEEIELQSLNRYILIF